ncbi:MAG: dTDP-4-dehydrorhamnose 3,5-epimerase [Bacteroidetes bacterium]|jgi:dTDP-4-dehydrorhamnose 3,5-epimerase|nr:dTDP-4-dehydrorhamnose 3,5-epimerase [Bacteroidota bacterium]
MEFIETAIKDLFVIQPKVFEDDRGYFFESYTQRSFLEKNIAANFVQDNQSLSQKGVLRGLHFQAPPFAQGKLVRVLKGAVLDVAVDIRKNSPTYGKHVAIELNEKNRTMLWVPEGFAHGFSTLEDNTIFVYKCTNYYNKASEGCVSYCDKDLQIDWKTDKPQLSQKDLEGTPFRDFVSPF